MFGGLLPAADGLLIHYVIIHVLERTLLVLNEKIHAVKRHPPVVANDASPAISVRQAGDDAVVPGPLHFVGVNVEYAIVVGFAVFEHLGNLGIHFAAVGL